METKQNELNGKFKALNFVINKIDDIVTERDKTTLKRYEQSLTNKVSAIYALKEVIEELKFIDQENEEDVRTWAEEIEGKLNDATFKMDKIKRVIKEIEDEEIRTKRERDEAIRREVIGAETEKRLDIEKARLELERAHKEEERKRDLEHQGKILKQQMEFQKSIASSAEKSKEVKNIKLPKLSITKFSGKFSDWLPFWNTFEAEIDSTDLPAVSKFGYLKELLEPKVRVDIDGLPFSIEGYERAKNILKSEYGKSSEIINAHIQNIMDLPVITGTDPAKVHDFYKTLSHNVQALETLGKVERVNGTTRAVLEKLKGIKTDLVRGEEGWQEWDLPRLVVALKKWKDINISIGNDSLEQNKQKRFRSNPNMYLTKEGERKKRGCVYCEDANHTSKDCSKVSTVSARKKILAEKKLCFNCTGMKHRASDCKSTINCQKCNQKHHTSICTKDQPLLTATGTSYEPLVYPVVVVNVEGVKCRALLDTGAGSSYASAALLNRLPNREHSKEVRRVEMMLGSVTREMDLSSINVAALDGSFQMNVNVTKVGKKELLSVDNPNYAKLISSYAHLKGIHVEDNDKKSKLPIHLILGASDYLCIKTDEPSRVGKTGDPVAEKTKFGWTVIAKGKEIDYTAMLLTQTSQTDYEQLCRLDVLGLEDRPEHDQVGVYAEFREQLERNELGWYETGLPWKGNHPSLPTHEAGSLKRLNSLTRKLKQNDLYEPYAEIIETQKQEGIVEDASSPSVGTEFYIPHKPVVRETAESTKLRIVYDASARAYPQAPSLNDCLNAGPPLQNRLWDVLVRMRFHPVALTGDLKQAFLQVRIKRAERDALRFHWKANEDEEVETLRFTRALFGLTCSPFLLGGVIEHHLESWEGRKPAEVKELRKSMYVDDLISGKPTITEAKEFKQGASEIFRDATFTLHKWHSNAPELEEAADNSADDVTYAKQQLGATQRAESSLLGLQWDKQRDQISVNIPSESATPTKRGTLQKLAKVYDPLGLVSPQTLQGKMIYREICQKKVGWDAPLDDDVKKKLLLWERKLPERVSAPRSLIKFREEIQAIELHAFGDASGEGISGVVYAIIRQSSGVSRGLVAAKARLAKQGLTIPRLELVSAHMAANLVGNVESALEGFPVTVVQGWLDSTVALYWLNGGGEYKQFVANRVRKIKSNERLQWRHVPTKDNPADLGSRGGPVENNQLWWNGPHWLTDRESWPNDITIEATRESNAEAKIIRQVFAVAVEMADKVDELLQKFSMWKTLRICGWLNRFINNCRNPDRRKRGPLTTEEIENQRLFWIRRAQSSSDKEEDRLRLNVQLNELNILECRGRIQGRYPTYIPDSHPFAIKLVEHSHLSTLHGGVSMTMAHAREKYWVPRLRQLARKVIKNCFGCRRFQAKALEQPPPGLLPRERTEGNRPFQAVGVDFAGPVKYRSLKTEKKAYIVLFACSLTRAVYVELLHSLHAQEFIRTLKRFIARRGRPQKIFSDNGTTFLAAARWLKTVRKDEKLQNFLAESDIHWQFNLSRAPWWGGQFERLIGLVKRALQKTIGGGCLKWNEMEEVLLDVEVALNNRPLSYVEEDIQMPTLTPSSMLFVGSNAIPELEAHNEEEKDLRKRAKFLFRCKKAVWQRWSTEYLRGLRERHNQNKGTKVMNVKKGDVVIIKSDERNKAKWPLGIVDELFEGRDGVVRAVRLRAGKNFLERSPNQLYPLELSCDRKIVNNRAPLNPTVPPFRPRRDAAAAARQRIQDVADHER